MHVSYRLFYIYIFTYPKAILTLPMAKSPTYSKEEYMFAFQIVALDKPEKNHFQQKSSTSSNNGKVVFEKEFAHVESDLTQNVVTKSRTLMYMHMNWKKKCTGMSESSTHC